MENTFCKQDKRPPVNIETKPTPDPQNETEPAENIKVLIPTPIITKTAAGTSYLMQVVYEHLPLAQ